MPITHALIFVAPKFDPFSILIIILIIVLIMGGAFLWTLFVRYVIHGKQYVANRAKAETLCTWEYSAAEWQLYAKEFELGSNPVGPARVRITPLDLWFTDDSEVRRKPISSAIMMVTNCDYTGNLLRIRIRSHSSPGRNDYYHCHDYLIPVPAGKMSVVIEAVKYFENVIALSPEKLDWVTPSDIYLSINGKSDFC